MARKILIIDDEVDLARIYQSHLERAGYEVAVVIPGESDLGEIDRHWDTIDLVITDILMPEISYKDIISRAKKSSIPYLVITGDVSDEPHHYNKLEVFGKLVSIVKEALDNK